MYNIYEIEQISAKLWSVAFKISAGDYEERGLTSRECRALYEIVEASKRIAAKEEYVKEISS